MKAISILFVSICILSCSAEETEEFAFRKSFEFQLIRKCPENHPDCANDIKSQIKECMVESDWRKFLNDQENKEELKRFTEDIFSCIVDKDGRPYFESNV